MRLPEKGTLLRIFIGESDRCAQTNRPLHEAIVLRAREAHLAGATVTRGVMGYGKHSRLHTAKILRLSEDLPIIVEIAAFLPWLDENVREGLVTMEAVRVIHYRAEEPNQPAS